MFCDNTAMSLLSYRCIPVCTRPSCSNVSFHSINHPLFLIRGKQKGVGPSYLGMVRAPDQYIVNSEHTFLLPKTGVLSALNGLSFKSLSEQLSTIHFIEL